MNSGLTIAKNHGFQWILTLDDDSLVKKNMVSRLIYYLDLLDGNTDVGLIGMAWSPTGAERNSEKSSLRLWEDKRGIITSGSLFSMATYQTWGSPRNLLSE